MTSVLSTRPALRFALWMAVGIASGRELEIASGTVLWMLGALFLAALVARALRRPHAPGILLASSVAMLGAFLIGKRVADWESRILDVRTGYDEVRITGVVLEEPVRKGGRARFVVEAESVKVRGRQRSPSVIMVRLRHADSVRTELRAGAVVSLSGLLDPMPVKRNPGDRDPRLYYCLHDITGFLSADGPDVEGAEPGQRSFGAVVAAARRALGDVLDRHHEGETRSYLKGIVLALRSEMSDDQREAFLLSGTFHVIAVSGLHVGLITVMLHAVLGLLRLPRKALTIVTMCGVVAYMIIVGSSPSVVRAAIMACVVLGGRLLERPVDAFQSLGVAAAIVMALDPVQLFDPGFQLSFAAVLGIVTLYPLWSGVLERIHVRTAGSKMITAGMQLVLVSFAAQVGTLPLTILLFERISLVSLAANLVIVPLSSLNVALGIATVALAPVSEALAAPYAALNDLVALGVLASARFASNLPGASVVTTGWSVFAAGALSVGLVGILSIRRPAVLKLCFLLLLALADCWVYASLVKVRPKRLTVSVLDVGQGDAILIESPDEHTVLIDAGPAGWDYDAGERILLPYFRRRGINRLDAVILTHAHSDHIGGMPAVLERLEVKRLLVATDSAPSRTARNTLETARTWGTKLEQAVRGTVVPLGASARLYVLHPRPDPSRWKTLNNISIVCKLVYGDVSFLLAGDIESPIEEELVSRYGSFLKSDVLKVAHHGSSTSSSPAFLNAVAPHEALISVGWRNRFYHPSPGVLRELTRRGIRIRRTDRSGALVLTSDGSHITVSLWRK